MGRIPVFDLAPGMVLAEDLVTPGGRFLMPRGTRLNESHLQSISGWGIEEAVVDEPAEERSAAPGPAGPAGPPQGGSRVAAPEDFLQDARKMAIRRFRHVDLNHEAAQVLFKLCVARTAKKMALDHNAGIEPEPEQSLEGVPRDVGAIPSPDDILKEDPQLVSLPEVFVRINDVLKNPNSTIDDATDVISMDPSLSAKLLKLVNSAFYGRTMRAAQGRFPTKVDTLSRAVTIVGGKQLATIALGVSVLPIFHDIPKEFINMRSFWKHSIACGVIARGLAAKTSPGAEESCFVAGLLHDIGRLIMYKHMPAASGAALVRARSESLPLTSVERELFGWDHARMGGLLLRKWQYPEALENMVRLHHRMDEPLCRREPAVVHVADVIANAMDVGSSGEVFTPDIIPEAWEALDMAPDELKTVISHVGSQIGEIFRSFFPEDAAPDGRA